jgi:predicted SprT family Zn-dependent metalloprotease
MPRARPIRTTGAQSTETATTPTVNIPKKPRGTTPWLDEGISKTEWYRRRRQAAHGVDRQVTRKLLKPFGRRARADNPVEPISGSPLWLKNENTPEERISAAKRTLGLSAEHSTIDDIENACDASLKGCDASMQARVRAYAQFLKDHQPTEGAAVAVIAAAEIDALPATITLAEYRQWQQAWDYFDEHLFGSKVPAKVMVTLLRKANMAGHYADGRYSHRTDEGRRVAEVAMNPDAFVGRTDEQILSTLAHEMVHCWQYMHGNPARRAYHNKEWAAKMKAIGLQPSSTGAVGGKETGQRMTHYVIPGGIFCKVCADLLSTGFRLEWQSTPHSNERKPPSSKTKFTCMRCAQNAWGKPDLGVICELCYDEDRTIQRMLPPKDMEEGDLDRTTH